MCSFDFFFFFIFIYFYDVVCLSSSLFVVFPMVSHLLPCVFVILRRQQADENLWCPHDSVIGAVRGGHSGPDTRLPVVRYEDVEI